MRLKIVKPLLICFCLAFFDCVTAAGVMLHGTDLTLYDVAALLLHACSFTICIHLIVGYEQETLTFDISHPESMFALFYLAFYVVLNWLAIVFDQPGHKHSLEIAALTLAGLICFRVGIWCSGYKRSGQGFRLPAEKAEFLYKLAKVSMLLLVGYFIWKIQNGTFFSHAGYIAQDKTVFASIMQNVIGDLHIPLFLLFGPLLLSLPPAKVKGARRLLLVYMAVSVIVLTLAGTTFLMLAAVLFTAASLNLERKKPIQLRTYFAGFALCLFLFGIVLSVRAVAASSGNFSQSGNQLNSVISSIGKKTNRTTHVKGATFDRAFSQVNLLSRIMDRLDNGFDYLHGDVLWSLGYSLIPRVVWPGKPLVTPAQLLVERAYSLPLTDNAIGPLMESYINGGWPVVIITFIGMGWLVGAMTKRAAFKTSMTSVLILCYWWFVISDLERELLISFFALLRTLAVIALCYYAYRSVKAVWKFLVLDVPPVAPAKVSGRAMPD